MIHTSYLIYDDDFNICGVVNSEDVDELELIRGLPEYFFHETFYRYDNLDSLLKALRDEYPDALFDASYPDPKESYHD